MPFSTKIHMEAKIVGGIPVPIEKYPFAAMLLIQNWLCAGTILNSWSVLTAAHCFDGNNVSVSDIHVLVGASTENATSKEVYTVSNIMTHEDYDKNFDYACDIAMIFVSTPFRFSERVKKAVLVNNKQWMSEKEMKFVVFGWGLIRDGGPLSSKLLITKLRFIYRYRCAEMNGHALSSDMFCLYGEGKRDSCGGDSGGGVFWKGLLVGLVSHGESCAVLNKPGIYCNVWFFRKWIQKKIQAFRTFYCRQARKIGSIAGT